MVNKPKQIGTAAETAIVRTAQRLGFPGARRLVLTGANDQGDIELTPNIIIEAKGGTAAETASHERINTWLQETAKETHNHPTATIGFLITKRKGHGHSNAQNWHAHFHHQTWATLIGYQLPPTADPHATITTTLNSALALLRAAGHSGTPRDVLSCPGTQGVTEVAEVQVEVPEFVVGSLVRVGRGRKLWRVAEIWSDRPAATLTPLEGYSSTTVDIDRLVAVSEREAA